jgi:ribosomal protein S18 acetylase RimI-like enzyme
MRRKPNGLIATSAITDADLRAIRALRDRCNALEGLTLKLNLTSGDAIRPPSRFLYYDRGRLVGYAALDGGALEAELCGMVHPSHRRRGIGRELLEAARAACRRDGIVRLLVISEEASRSGQGFVAAIGGIFEFAEKHLEMETKAASSVSKLRLTVREATTADADAIARVIVSAFGGEELRVRSRLDLELVELNARYYVGQLGGEEIAALKVYFGEHAGIYAFGVLADRRGQGYGRELLTRVIELLRRKGYRRVYLEVDLDNEAAQHLYRSVGFFEATTYEYFAVPLF